MEEAALLWKQFKERTQDFTEDQMQQIRATLSILSKPFDPSAQPPLFTSHHPYSIHKAGCFTHQTFSMKPCIVPMEAWIQAEHA